MAKKSKTVKILPTIENVSLADIKKCKDITGIPTDSKLVRFLLKEYPVLKMSLQDTLNKLQWERDSNMKIKNNLLEFKNSFDRLMK